MPTSLLTAIIPALTVYSRSTLQEITAECFFFSSFLLVFVLNALLQKQWNQIFDGLYLIVLGALGLHGVSSNRWFLLAWISYALSCATIGAICILTLKDRDSKVLRVLLLLVVAGLQKALFMEVRYTLMLDKILGENLLVATQIITFSLLLYQFNWVFSPSISFFVSLLGSFFSFLHLPLLFQAQFFVMLYIKILAFMAAIYGMNGRFSMWHLFGQVLANIIVQDLLVKRKKAFVIEKMSQLVVKHKNSYTEARKLMNEELKETRKMMEDNFDKIEKECKDITSDLSEQERSLINHKYELRKKALQGRYNELSQRWKRECAEIKNKIRELENQVKQLKQRA